jgi:hypothetical protein
MRHCPCKSSVSIKIESHPPGFSKRAAISITQISSKETILIFFSNKIVVLSEFCDSFSLSGLTRFIRRLLNVSKLSSVPRTVIRLQILMHRLNFAHVEMKPDKVFAISDGSVKVSDFGIDGRLNQFWMCCLWQEAHLWLSWKYIRKGDFLPTSNIWSVGIAAIELFIGKVPYTAFLSGAARTAC